MEIDLRNNYSNLNLSYKDEYQVKGNKLLTELNRININMSIKHNYLIIPISVYNIIECVSSFIPFNSNNTNHSILTKVGSLGEFEIYLDIYLPPDQILVSWDKQTARDVKINSLLKGIDEKEKRVKIKS